MSVYRRLMRNCWRKTRYHSLAIVGKVAAEAAAREGAPIYFYPCPYGDHYHLTRHASFGGQRLTVAATPKRRAQDRMLDKS